MENSDTTISTSFLDNFWPPILNHNESDLQCTSATKYSLHEKKFEHVWTHELLTNKSYKNFVPSIGLTCKQTAGKQTEITTEGEIEQLPYRGPDADILPLDKQLAIVQQDVEIRQKLANDFVNRTFPWYIQRPTYLADFKITDEIKELFKYQCELNVLQNIQRFQCHLMIIDVGRAVPLNHLKRWLKFSPYTSIVTVIHDAELYEKVKNSNFAFKAVFMEETFSSNLQEELQLSLKMGIEKAKELFLLDDSSVPIVFVSSQSRGKCVCNKFKILKKL